jgi:flagellar biosynthesis/type III secretory pathway protein FliH
MDNCQIDYQKRCIQLKEEIIQSIKDGTREGIQQGIQNGFLEGIKESADMGFTNLMETLSTDTDVFLNIMATSVVEQEVENRVKSVICPSIKIRMDRACQNVLQNIQVNKQEGTLFNIDQELDLEGLSQGQLDQCIQSLSQYLPQNFIFGSLFNGCESALTTCLTENVQDCRQLVQDKIDILSDISGVDDAR